MESMHAIDMRALANGADDGARRPIGEHTDVMWGEGGVAQFGSARGSCSQAGARGWPRGNDPRWRVIGRCHSAGGGSQCPVGEYTVLPVRSSGRSILLL